MLDQLAGHAHQHGPPQVRQAVRRWRLQISSSPTRGCAPLAAGEQHPAGDAEVAGLNLVDNDEQSGWVRHAKVTTSLAERVRRARVR
jgi:hypothetical protein